MPPARRCKNNSYTPCVFVIYHRRVFRGMHLFLCVSCMFCVCGMHFLCVACMCFVCPQHLWQCASWSIVNTTYSNTTYSKACNNTCSSLFLSQGQQGSGLFFIQVVVSNLVAFYLKAPRGNSLAVAGLPTGNSLAVAGLPTNALAGAGR